MKKQTSGVDTLPIKTGIRDSVATAKSLDDVKQAKLVAIDALEEAEREWIAGADLTKNEIRDLLSDRDDGVVMALFRNPNWNKEDRARVERRALKESLNRSRNGWGHWSTGDVFILEASATTGVICADVESKLWAILNDSRAKEEDRARAAGILALIPESRSGMGPGATFSAILEAFDGVKRWTVGQQLATVELNGKVNVEFAELYIQYGAKRANGLDLFAELGQEQVRCMAVRCARDGWVGVATEHLRMFLDRELAEELGAGSEVARSLYLTAFKRSMLNGLDGADSVKVAGALLSGANVHEASRFMAKAQGLLKGELIRQIGKIQHGSSAIGAVTVQGPARQ